MCNWIHPNPTALSPTRSTLSDDLSVHMTYVVQRNKCNVQLPHSFPTSQKNKQTKESATRAKYASMVTKIKKKFFSFAVHNVDDVVLQAVCPMFVTQFVYVCLSVMNSSYYLFTEVRAYCSWDNSRRHLSGSCYMMTISSWYSTSWFVILFWFLCRSADFVCVFWCAGCEFCIRSTHSRSSSCWADYVC